MGNHGKLEVISLEGTCPRTRLLGAHPVMGCGFVKIGPADAIRKKKIVLLESNLEPNVIVCVQTILLLRIHFNMFQSVLEVRLVT